MEHVYRRILAELLDEIVARRVAGGERLPTVDEIAARHACSPNAAREAIRALEERGVVAVQPGRGQVVLGDDRWMVLDRDVAEAALLRGADQQLLREAVDFLRHVEIRAAMLAAPRVTDRDIDYLAQTIDRMRAAGGGDGLVEAETDFHRTLILLARNRFLGAALEGLHPVLVTARRHRAAGPDTTLIVLHERIVAALAERDPTAIAAAIEDYARHMASRLRA